MQPKRNRVPRERTGAEGMPRVRRAFKKQKGIIDRRDKSIGLIDAPTLTYVDASLASHSCNPAWIVNVIEQSKVPHALNGRNISRDAPSSFVVATIRRA